MAVSRALKDGLGWVDRVCTVVQGVGAAVS
jgi:hypothetical protein